MYYLINQYKKFKDYYLLYVTFLFDWYVINNSLLKYSNNIYIIW